MKNIGIWVGLLLAAFGASLFIMSLSMSYYGKYGPGPGLFPLWISGLLVVLSVMYIIDSIGKESLSFKNVIPEKRIVKKLATILGAILFFILAAPYLGFFCASVIAVAMLLWRDYSRRWSVTIAVILTAVLYVVFGILLDIPLPVNIWGW
ncbi:MAG: tripartite tricarboxylate transporter TctB family protein [Alcaligenaceae bacterium]|nr:tripartite tricarboxylate transporter TctB family protein [Alcaligenaceae bacterium]